MRAPITLLLAGLALAATACGAPGEQTAAAAATLPDLRGKTLEHARERADAGGWDLESEGIGGGNTCLDSEACTVFRMEPDPGEAVEAGAEVTVAYVTADERRWYARHKRMPKVVGMLDGRVAKLFKPVADTVDVETEEKAGMPAGTVLRQSPKAGKPLKVGQQIKLVVSRGRSDADATPGNPDVDVDNHDGETKLCRGKWWC